jgi:type II secretory pathway component PulF
MKTFVYAYQTKGGLIVTGRVVCASRKEAIENLKADSEGILILSIVEG